MAHEFARIAQSSIAGVAVIVSAQEFLLLGRTRFGAAAFAPVSGAPR